MCKSIKDWLKHRIEYIEDTLERKLSKQEFDLFEYAYLKGYKDAIKKESKENNQ